MLWWPQPETGRLLSWTAPVTVSPACRWWALLSRRRCWFAVPRAALLTASPTLPRSTAGQDDPQGFHPQDPRNLPGRPAARGASRGTVPAVPPCHCAVPPASYRGVHLAALAGPPSTSTCLHGRPMLSLPPALLQAQSSDRRVLAAAAEIVKKGLARITLLGKPQEVRGHLGLPAAGKGAVRSDAHWMHRVGWLHLLPPRPPSQDPTCPVPHPSAANRAGACMRREVQRGHRRLRRA